MLVIAACATPYQSKPNQDTTDKYASLVIYDEKEVNRARDKLESGDQAVDQTDPLGFSFKPYNYYAIFREVDSSGPALNKRNKLIFNTGWKDLLGERYEWAFDNFQTTATAGFTWSEYLLGAMHLKGIGTLQDFVQAHMWLNIAASQGHKRAAAYLEILTIDMTPEQIAEAQKLARECVANDYKDC